MAKPLNPAAERAAQLRLMDSVTDRLEPRIRSEIARTNRAIAATLGDTTKHAAIYADHRQRMELILRNMWMTTGTLIADRVLARLGVTASFSRGAFEERMSNWIRSEGATRVAMISTTTRDRINQSITRGIEEGLSLDQIARSIRTTSAIESAVRANVIARTETHNAAGSSSQEAAKELGLTNLRKTWLASIDGRERETHAEANGQEVGLNEVFVVGGFPMMYPGDTSAPASETINCRCVAVYTAE